MIQQTTECPKASYSPVSVVARRIKARPADISWLLYNRKFPDDFAPLIGGRRMIPDDLIWMVASKLQQAGKPVDPAAISAGVHGATEQH